MAHYDYTKRLHDVWDKAVRLYRAGQRSAATYFTPEETAFLASIGATPQEIYDFAEDFASGGEPDFATFAAIHDLRRSYFLEEQQGRPSGAQLDPASLPAKDAVSPRGLRWLPRIIPKARAKLRGELSPDIMYSCGGDRAFLKEHDIHPAEFLRAVWKYGDNHQLIEEWVVNRSQQAKAN